MPVRRARRPPHLGHADGTHGQRLVAQDGPVFVALPPLQHDLQLVAFSLQEVGVLQEKGPRLPSTLGPPAAHVPPEARPSSGHRGPSTLKRQWRACGVRRASRGASQRLCAPRCPWRRGRPGHPRGGAAGVLTTAELVWVTHTVTSSWQSSHVNSDSEAGRRDRPAPGQTRSHTCACCFPLMDPHARRRRTARSADPTPRRTTDTKPRHPALGSRAGVRVPATARSGPGGPCTRVGGGSGEGVGQSGQDCPALDVAGPPPPLTLTVRKSSFNGSGLNTV